MQNETETLQKGSGDQGLFFRTTVQQDWKPADVSKVKDGSRSARAGPSPPAPPFIFLSSCLTKDKDGDGDSCAHARTHTHTEASCRSVVSQNLLSLIFHTYAAPQLLLYPSPLVYRLPRPSCRFPPPSLDALADPTPPPPPLYLCVPRVISLLAPRHRARPLGRKREGWRAVRGRCWQTPPCL